MDTKMALVPVDTTQTGLIDLWMRGKSSEHTKRAYGHDLARFQMFLGRDGKMLKDATLVDLMDFYDELGDEHNLSDNSRKRIMSTMKSFYTFAHKTGLYPINIGSAFVVPKVRETLGKRILGESLVLTMIGMEKNGRNQAILRLLYYGALRVSELCNLQWSDVQERVDGGQVEIFGKGRKTRNVLLHDLAWASLQELQKRRGDDTYVFQSRQQKSVKGDKGERMSEVQVLNIVREAAKRAGVQNWQEVSPHWLRHAHASHAIDRGAPITVVRDTLGHSNVAVTDKYGHARPNTSSSRWLS